MRVSGDSLMHVHEKVKVFKSSFKIRFVYSCETENETKPNQPKLCFHTHAQTLPRPGLGKR